jgi:ADP-heptose:LPS heptosyltransferase
VQKIYLFTEIKGIENIITTYDGVHPYREVGFQKTDCDLMIRLVYELSDNKKTYINGFMESIGFGDVTINDIPRLKDDYQRLFEGEYILIAPFVSQWEEKKRNWGYEKFVELSKLIEAQLGLRCVFLEQHYSFIEMVSLIRHCKFFIGNDSGPAIIAHSFKKTAFIIYGATRPEYVHMSQNSVSIYDGSRHKLCKHVSRRDELDCCEEFCMDKIDTQDVFDRIKSHI